MTRWLPLLAVSLCILVVPGRILADEDPLQPDRPENYELHKLLIETINHVERNYVEPIDRRKLVEAAIRGILSELDDYSDYVAPENMGDFRTAVSHEFAGIGIRVGMERGQLTVISPLVGSPAYRAGVISGDRILEIDGHRTKGLRLDEAIKLMKGKSGSPVVLKVSHPGRTEAEEVSLTREVIHLETVLGDLRGEDDQWDYLLDDEARIGYVRITGFGRNTAEELRSALKSLKEADVAGLVLDLRFNPGGLLSSAIQVADMFVAEGKIVSTAGRSVKEQVWEARKQGTFQDVPLVVLVNRFSASASEIVAACLQDHQRAIIVGERTYGKGSVQRVSEMEGGHSALKLTTAGYFRPSGKNIHRHSDDTLDDEWGVKPNEGFECSLSDVDAVALHRYRRARDTLNSSGGADDSEEAAGEADVNTEALEDTFDDRQLEVALTYLREKLTGQAAKTAEQSASANMGELAKATEEPKTRTETDDEKQAKPVAEEATK